MSRFSNQYYDPNHPGWSHPKEAKMDNTFFVGAQGADIVIMRPVPNRLTREQALNLAAWIVAITDEDEFAKVFKAVCNT